MKKTVNRYEFIDGMMSYYDGNGFTHEGLHVLFDYLEEYEEETGEEIEFDAVGLHCQFSEMKVKDFINDYNDGSIFFTNLLELGEEVTAEMLDTFGSPVIAVVDENTVIVDTAML